MLRLLKRTAAASLIAAGLVAATGSAGADPATDVVAGWLAEIGANDAVAVEHGALEEVDGGARLDALKITVPLSFDTEEGRLDVQLAVEASEVLFRRPAETDAGFSIDQLTIPGILETTVTGTLTPHAATDNQSADAGSFESRVRYHDLEAFGLFSPRLPLLDADPARPVSRYRDWLRLVLDMRMASATVGAVDIITTIPDGTRTNDRYEEVVVFGIEDGTVEEESVSRITSEQTLANMDGSDTVHRVQVTTGRYTARNIDLRPLFRALAILPQDATASTEFLAESEINDISVDFPGGTAALRKVRMEGFTFEMDGEPIDVLALADSAVSGEALDETAFAKEILQIADGFSLDRVEFEAAALNAPGATAALDRIIVRDASSAGVGLLALEGLALSSPQLGSVTLSRVALEDLTTAPFISYLDVASPKAPTPEIADILPLVPTLGRLEIRRLATALPGDAGAGAGLNRARLAMGNFIGPIPTAIKSDIDGLRLPLDLIDDATVRQALEAAGLTVVSYGDALRLKWDEETEQLRLERLDMRLENGVRVELSLTFGGISRTVFEHPEQAQEALATATVIGGRLLITDAKAMTAFLQRQAAEAKLSTETLALGLADQAIAELGPVGQSPFGQELHEALKTFFRTGKRLEVSLTPTQPVPVTQLLGLAAAAPGQIADVLNAKVIAEQ